MGLKSELKVFLEDNFNGLILRAPLFYNWPIGLRFNLQTSPVFTPEYFAEVTRRATVLFESAFDKDDTVIVVIRKSKWRKQRIKKSDNLRKLIENDATTSVHSLTKNIYAPDQCLFNQIIIKGSVSAINYTHFFKDFAYADFPNGGPNFFNYEIYFINTDKKLIFYMYDDRGLDIIATDKETIRPIYQKYNNIILECDRAKIEKTLKLLN
jgi:Domain of unknown function (DUF3885)